MHRSFPFSQFILESCWNILRIEREYFPSSATQLFCEVPNLPKMKLYPHPEFLATTICHVSSHFFVRTWLFLSVATTKTPDTIPSECLLAFTFAYDVCSEIASSTFHIKTLRSSLPMDTMCVSFAENLTHEMPPTWPETSLQPTCKQGEQSCRGIELTVLYTSNLIPTIILEDHDPSFNLYRWRKLAGWVWAAEIVLNVLP